MLRINYPMIFLILQYSSLKLFLKIVYTSIDSELTSKFVDVKNSFAATMNKIVQSTTNYGISEIFRSRNEYVLTKTNL